jgi:hypothetical protein
MGMSGGGGSTNTVQKSDPWEGQQPYLTGNTTPGWAPGYTQDYSSPGGPGIFGAAQTLYTDRSAWPGYYPGMPGVSSPNSPTYVGMTDQQKALANQITQTGAAGGPGSLSAANSTLQGMLSPNYTAGTQGQFATGQAMLDRMMNGGYENMYSNAANQGQSLLAGQATGNYTNSASNAMNSGLGMLGSMTNGSYQNAASGAFNNGLNSTGSIAQVGQLANGATTPAYGQAQGVLQNQLSSDYLNPWNSDSFGTVVNNTLASVMPSINSSFVSGNRSGGGLAARAASMGATDAVGNLAQNQFNQNQQIQQNAVAQAAANQNASTQNALNAAQQGTSAYLGQGQMQQNAAQQALNSYLGQGQLAQGAAGQALQGYLGQGALASNAAQQAANNFLTQQGNQIKGTAVAPSVDQGLMSNLGIGLNAAGLTQTDLQNMVNSNANQWNYNQSLPWNMLGQYSNAIQGQYGGTTSQSTPYYTNPIANAVSGIAGGAALGGTIAGPYGAAAGAGLGLITSFMGK